MKAAILLGVVLSLSGCIHVSYLAYRGTQAWPTGSAFVRTIDGVEVIEGLPNRDYEVIGLIDVYDDKPFYHNDYVRRKVIAIAKNQRADALVWLSDRLVTSGSYKIGSQSEDPASLDSGRSSQPEVVVTNVSQYSSTQYKKTLRSSLLVVRWK